MANSPQNWFEVIKEKIGTTAESLNLSSAVVTESAIAVGAGFAIGYFAKKYGRPLFTTTILLIALLAVLHYFSIITIEWSKIKALIGLSPQEDAQAVVANITEWMKAHIPALVAGGVAFFIGNILG